MTSSNNIYFSKPLLGSFSFENLLNLNFRNVVNHRFILTPFKSNEQFKLFVKSLVKPLLIVTLTAGLAVSMATILTPLSLPIALFVWGLIPIVFMSLALIFELCHLPKGNNACSVLANYFIEANLSFLTGLYVSAAGILFLVTRGAATTFSTLSKLSIFSSDTHANNHPSENATIFDEDEKSIDSDGISNPSPG